MRILLDQADMRVRKGIVHPVVYFSSYKQATSRTRRHNLISLYPYLMQHQLSRGLVFFNVIQGPWSVRAVRWRFDVQRA